MKNIEDFRLRVGGVIPVGHNGSKSLGDEYLSYTDVRIEAIGSDWIIVRTYEGLSASVNFAEPTDIREMVEELMS